MLTCTSCGNIVNEGDKFCQYCGTLVVNAAPVAPAAPVMVCTGCGGALEEGDKFCQLCGTPVGAAAPAPIVEETPAEIFVEEAAPKNVCVCGAELEDGDRFCQVCGRPVAAPVSADPVVEDLAPVVEEVEYVEPVIDFEPAVEEVEEPAVEEIPAFEEIAAAVEAVEDVTTYTEDEAAEEIVEEDVDDEVIVEEPAPEVLVLEIEEEDVPETEEKECEIEVEIEEVVEPMGYEFPYLLRRKNRQVIDVNKAFFRIGSEAAVNNYVLEGLGGMHAMLMTTAGKYYIVDLGTEGKTFVNGAEITPDTEVELTAGCALRLADEDFVFIV